MRALKLEKLRAGRRMSGGKAYEGVVRGVKAWRCPSSCDPAEWASHCLASLVQLKALKFPQMCPHPAVQLCTQSDKLQCCTVCVFLTHLCTSTHFILLLKNGLLAAVSILTRKSPECLRYMSSIYSSQPIQQSRKTRKSNEISV